MNTGEIRDLIQRTADARFGETIEKLLLLLRQQHGHQCWRKECSCGYCRFINGEYVDAKMVLHQMKKRMNWYEYHSLTFDEASGMMSLEHNLWLQKQRISALREHKKELRKDVL